MHSLRCSWRCLCLNCVDNVCRITLRRRPLIRRCQVFGKLLKMKRFAAVCGIALCLVSCLHQAHALCTLTGCRDTAKSCEEGASCRSTCCGRCSKCAACRSSQSSSDSCSACAMTRPVSSDCPSDGDCTCCQVQPAANPSLAGDSALTLLDTWFAEAPTSVVVEVSRAIDCREAVGSDVSPLRAVDFCASLCRFLA